MQEQLAVRQVAPECLTVRLKEYIGIQNNEKITMYHLCTFGACAMRPKYRHYLLEYAGAPHGLPARC